MISAKEAKERVEKLREDIVESYITEKTENLIIAERLINEEIQNLNTMVWMPHDVDFSSEELTYIRRKGYRCTGYHFDNYENGEWVGINTKYLISWSGSVYK